MNRKREFIKVSLVLMACVLFMFSACKKEVLVPATVTTAQTVSNIKTTSALSGGIVTDYGGPKIIMKGVCWSTKVDPTLTDSISLDGPGAGSYTSQLNYLIPNTTYYIRAYATNSAGTSYGLSVSFKTDNLTAVSTELVVTDITATTAVIGGTVMENKSDSVLARGVCWSTRINPTVDDSLTVDGKRNGNFVSKIINLLPNTMYFVRAYATDNSGTVYGDAVGFMTKKLAQVSTQMSVSKIYYSTAESGGVVISDGGESIIARGVCWNSEPNPTITDYKTMNGTGLGGFTSSLRNLENFTKYYIKAYVTTIAGTAYGDEVSFTTLKPVSDIDGNIYHEVTIGNQTWLLENLKTTKYRNGDLIGTTIATQILPNETSKYQWAYNDDESNVAKYGRLYSWYAVSDSRNLAPEGWHVASNTEWNILLNYLMANGYNYDGSIGGTAINNIVAKSLCAQADWELSTNDGAVGNKVSDNNISSFTALPAGSRSYNGIYDFLGRTASWWTSTEMSSVDGYYRSMNYLNANLMSATIDKRTGYSVRCIKD
ncbi:MAG: fibrobacter succinogenes major paralogous domain-containing protein [Paludibacter sp.]